MRHSGCASRMLACITLIAVTLADTAAAQSQSRANLPTRLLRGWVCRSASGTGPTVADRVGSVSIREQ
jgi:hypothetical protein